ncbi:Mlp family lipoprotein (plasmid) [Borreliella andersonii]|uniref:Mlp family lipoprotein n=1 Tax=Borrelia andersonii TaxID=42109 RepID=A0ACD5G6T6_BORAD
MKIIHIAFCIFLLILNGCDSNDNDPFNNNNKSAGLQQVKSKKTRDSDQGKSQKKEITLTPEEKKIFNSLVNTFKYTIEKLSENTNGCNNGNKDKCNGFFDWLSSTDPQKQKELAQAFTTVYNFLDFKRKLKEKDKDFDTYIKEAIDCEKNNQCNNNNKYGSGNSNDIEQYFRGVAGSIFTAKNDNDGIYQCLKDELLNDTNSHYSGLTINWQN